MHKKESPYKHLWIREHRGGGFDVMVYDPEVRQYALECLKTMTFADAAVANKERFGKDRAVSKSALHRYWKKHRKTILESWSQQGP